MQNDSIIFNLSRVTLQNIHAYRGDAHIYTFFSIFMYICVYTRTLHFFKWTQNKNEVAMYLALTTNRNRVSLLIFAPCMNTILGRVKNTRRGYLDFLGGSPPTFKPRVNSVDYAMKLRI